MGSIGRVNKIDKVHQSNTRQNNYSLYNGKRRLKDYVYHIGLIDNPKMFQQTFV